MFIFLGMLVTFIVSFVISLRNFLIFAKYYIVLHYIYIFLALEHNKCRNAVVPETIKKYVGFILIIYIQF